MIRYFCTYFDKNYLIRGLAMYKSLKDNCKDFRIWVLCLDDETYNIFSDIKPKNAILIKMDEFEAGDEELNKAKNNRSCIEYYFTCTPSLPLFIFRNYPEVNLITYIDADIYFYSEVEPIFNEIGDASITIIEHRFPKYTKEPFVHGIYNVAWLTFRKDEQGIGCLKFWRSKCNEWCYDRKEKDKFADQRYLDDWPNRFQNILVLQYKGADLAPWNIENYKISTENGRILVDGQPLIFFHFHEFKHLFWHIYDTGIGYYRTKVAVTVRKQIYMRYLAALLKENKNLSGYNNIFMLKSISRIRYDASFFASIHVKMRFFLELGYRILISGNYVICPIVD